VILLQAEGILGLEGAARALITPGMHVLNLVQGIYGKGMGYWITGFGGVLHELEVAYDDAVAPDAVERYLQEHPEIELLCVVHSETPSGTLSDCAQIGPIARRHGVITLVDALSSIGSTAFEADAWELDVCVGGGQKCLGGPSGISMISVSPAAWERIMANELAPRDSFLSLIDWKVKWLEGGRFPFTPSITDVFGLESALDQILEEGLEQSIVRHTRAAQATRAGAVAMGLALWPVSVEISSSAVTAIAMPEGVDPAAVVAHARSAYSVMLSTGETAGALVHIAHMGPTANTMYPVVGLAALGQTLLDLGAEVDVGAGVAAAMAALAPAV
jgi:pyridoxamine--pyruvate transaminase